MIETRSFNFESQRPVYVKAETWGKWLTRHGSQIVKGCVGIFGLVAFTGVGYFVKRCFVTKSSEVEKSPVANNTIAEINTAAETSANHDIFEYTNAEQNSCFVAKIGLPYRLKLPNGTFSDPDGDPLTLSAVVPPWLNFDPVTETFNGTPSNVSYSGNINVTMKATDPSGANVSGSFAIDVQGTFSAINTNVSVTYIENTPYHFNSPIVITTPSNTVTATLALDNPFAGRLLTDTSGSVTSTYHTTLGIWQGYGNTSDVNNLLTKLVLQPAIDFYGNYSIGVNIVDSFGQGVTDSIAVFGTEVQYAPVIHSPIISQAACCIATINKAYNFTLVANTFIERNRHTLTLTAVQADGTALPKWLSFNPDIQTFNGVPPQVGSLSIRITATNPSNLNVSDTFAIHTALARSIWPAVIELSSLNGKNGFKINGEAANDYSGYSVSAAGDINGDGIADLLIGAYGARNYAGSTYVVFGSHSGFPSSFELSSLNGTNGFKISGVTAGDQSGASISAAGDINGDGIADLLIGARYASPLGRNQAGSTYVVFGSRSAFPSSFELSSLNGTNGFRLNGVVANDRSGYSVSAAGDINGDGIDDLLLGAPNARGNAGITYVVFGSRSAFPSSLELSSLNDANGFKLNGEAVNDYSGFSVNAAGDINGDSIADLLVGAPYADSSGRNDAGSTYVVFGSRNAFPSSLELSNLNGTNGFKLNGEAVNDYSGFSVNAAGDINGDGIADLLIGAYNARPSGRNQAGSTYVVFGSCNSFSSSFELSSLNGINGFKLNGEATNDFSGWSVSAAGDINGDGISDLLIGAYGADHSGRGAAGSTYVVFGSRNGFPSSFELSSLNGINGFKLNGIAASDYSGISVSTAGDINGDGIADLLIGAPNASSSGRTNAGSTYVVFGSSLELWTNQLSLHRCNTVVLNSSHINATNGNQEDLSLQFSVSGVLHGRFQYVNNPGLAITSFNQSQIYNQQVQFIHDCSVLAPSYQIQVNSVQFSYISPLAASITFIPDVPVIIKNDLTIDERGSANITSTALNAYDPVARFADSDLIFSWSNLQHGYFAKWNDNLTALANFTQQNVKNGQIIFVHDQSRIAPNYNLTVSDGYVSSAFSFVAVHFTHMPHLVNNRLHVNEGLTTVLTSENLSASDPDTDVAELIFTPSNVQQGHFEYLNGTSLNSFPQWQVSNKMIQFKHSGGTAAPAYMISVSDGRLIEEPLSANVTFNHAPVLIRNKLDIYQSQTIIFSDANLLATDLETAADNLLFIVSGTEHGRFENSNSRQMVSNFTQGIMKKSFIQFVHDGSVGQPTYNIAVSDGAIITAPSPASVNFKFATSFTLLNNQLTIYENDTKTLTSSNLAVSNPGNFSSSEIIFHVSGLDHGHFQFSNDPGAIIDIFSKQNITDYEVQFAHDGSKIRPAYQVEVNARSETIQSTAAYIYFTNLPPTLLVNQITIKEAETVAITTANLNAVDKDVLAKDMVFTITSLLHGNFKKLGIVTFSFTLQEVKDGKISFTHDGSEFAPSYNVIVESLTYASSEPATAEIHFTNLPPSIVNNKLSLQEGNRIILGQNNLYSTDTGTTSSDITYTISGLQHGYFERTDAVGVAITSFTQDDISFGRIAFVHDYSKFAPSYFVSVSDGYANSTAQAVTIDQYRNLPPNLIANKIILKQGNTITLTRTNFNATDLDPSIQPQAIIFTVSNVQYGLFANSTAPSQAITGFTLQDIDDGKIVFVHDRSKNAPLYNVAVSDGYATSTAVLGEVQYNNLAPTLTTNQIILQQGQRLTLITTNLNASDIDTSLPATNIIFTISNVQHAQFENIAAPGTAILSFNLKNIQDNQIQFVHDNSKLTPSYFISVSDGSISSDTASANIQYTNLPPILHNNQLNILEGNILRLTKANLNATTPGITPTIITFIMSNVQHGRFVRNNVPGSAITSFTLQNIEDGLIQFIHDGGKIAPSYAVAVFDGYVTTSPQSGNITYSNVAPTLTARKIILKQGETITLTRTNFNAADLDPSIQPQAIIFTASNVRHGRFANSTLPAQAISSFALQDIDDDKIIFVHDGSKNAPLYNIAVSDGYASSTAVLGEVQYNNLAPTLTNNQITLQQGQRLTLTTTNLNATDLDTSLPATSIIFTVSNVQHAQFENIAAPGTAILSFNLRNIQDSQIQFVHDNSKLTPSYYVSVSDGNISTNAVSANIQYINLAPVLHNNQLSLVEGQTLTLTPTHLNATTPGITPTTITFNVANVQHGRFVRNNVPGSAITSFTLQNIEDGLIQFIHDGGKIAPSYAVAVFDGYVTTSPQSGNITYSNVAPTLTARKIILKQGETITLTRTNFNAADLDPSIQPQAIIFAVSNVQHGRFANSTLPTQAISSFALQDIDDGKIIFVHDGSKNAPLYNIAVSDGYASSTAVLGEVQYNNLAPTLTTNQITLQQGQRLTLTTTNLNATDLDTSLPATSLIFTVSNVQHAQFENIAAPGTAILSFNLRNIQDSQIQFVHDNSKLTPSYYVSVSDGNISTNAVSANIQYINLAPILHNNQLSLIEGQTLTLTPTHLNATTPGITPTTITFNVANVQHGRFVRNNVPGSAITSFTLQNIEDGLIQFIHDGGKIAPSYAVAVFDGYVTTSPQSGNITYSNVAPTLTARKIILKQGETITLTRTNFNAADLDPSIQPQAIIFTVSNVQHGRFANSTAPSQSITGFTLQDIDDGKIVFVHNGSKNAPLYNVAVSDGYASSTAVLGEVQYNNLAPTLTTNQIILQQGQRLTLNATNLNATDLDTSLPATNIIFIVSNVQHARFEDISNPGVTITTFTLQNIQGNQIQFVHDNSKIMPSYSIRVSDGNIISSVLSANIQYMNLPPFLNANTITLKQGEVILLNLANLNASSMGISLTEQITFQVSEIQHGKFESIANPGIAILTFTLKDIQESKIKFIHDKSKQRPSYKVVVFDGYLNTTATKAEVTYSTLPPVLIKNQITLNEGGSILLDTSNFNATAIDPSLQPRYLLFTVNNVQHAYFANATTGEEISRFSMQDILDGQVRFVHDKSKIKPKYSLTVSDGSDSDAREGKISFNNLPPILTVNEMRIERGARLLVTTQHLNASDPSPSITSDLLLFTIFDLVHGQFENMLSTPGMVVSNFTLQHIINSKINFVHDGNNVASNYKITVSDGYATSVPESAKIVFSIPDIQIPNISTLGIVGIAVGSSVGLLILSGLGIFLWRRSKQQLRLSTNEVDMEDISFENIKLIKKIGRGGFSDVFLGNWQGAGVAVKIINDLTGLSPETLKEFTRELGIMKRLRHPNVVQFFAGAVDTQRNKCYLIMEYMPLGSLTNVLADRRTYPLSWEKRMKMMLEAATGLQYLHNLHPPIIHRDIKSLNFLVSSELIIKISDFGASKITQNNRNTTTAMTGTPLWSAPETLQGAPNTEKSDIFSLGMVFWEILTRRLPFANEPMVTVMMAIAMKGKRETLPVWTPPYLANLIFNMWAVDPMQRPDSIRVVETLNQHKNKQLELTAQVLDQSDLVSVESSSGSKKEKTKNKKMSQGQEMQEIGHQHPSTLLTAAKPSPLFVAPSASLSAARQSVLFVPAPAAKNQSAGSSSTAENKNPVSGSGGQANLKL